MFYFYKNVVLNCFASDLRLNFAVVINVCNVFLSSYREDTSDSELAKQISVSSSATLVNLIVIFYSDFLIFKLLGVEEKDIILI